MARFEISLRKQANDTIIIEVDAVNKDIAAVKAKLMAESLNTPLNKLMYDGNGQEISIDMRATLNGVLHAKVTHADDEGNWEVEAVNVT
jgi:hypothetical protein